MFAFLYQSSRSRATADFSLSPPAGLAVIGPEPNYRMGGNSSRQTEQPGTSSHRPGHSFNAAASRSGATGFQHIARPTAASTRAAGSASNPTPSRPVRPVIHPHRPVDNGQASASHSRAVVTGASNQKPASSGNRLLSMIETGITIVNTVERIGSLISATSAAMASVEENKTKPAHTPLVRVDPSPLWHEPIAHSIVPLPNFTPGDFKFLTPDYANDNILIRQNGKLASRRNSGIVSSIVYFDQELGADKRLSFKVEASMSTSAEFAFSFGLTTCDTRSVLLNECHAVMPCNPQNSCRGSTLIVDVRGCRRAGDVVHFDWKSERNSRIRGDVRMCLQVSGRVQFKKFDVKGIFERGKKAYPFIMLSGDVECIRIISAEEAANNPASSTSHNVYCGLDGSTNILDALRATNSMLNTQRTRGKWLASNYVTFRSFLISRVVDATLFPCYIFRTEAFDLHRSICLQIEEMDNLFTGVLMFGVTTKKPADIRLDPLPANSQEIPETLGETGWYTHVLNVCNGQKFIIRRNYKGIFVKERPEGQAETLAFALDRNEIVYPFFNFFGGVKSIRLLRDNLEPITPAGQGAPRAINSQTYFRDRPKAQVAVKSKMATNSKDKDTSSTSNECCVCMDKAKVMMCNPCNHVVYCEGCKVDAEMEGLRTCPICRAHVSSYTRIFM